MARAEVLVIALRFTASALIGLTWALAFASVYVVYTY